ncbi:hypothetical protein PGB90_004934 [Kerria lacca]
MAVARSEPIENDRFGGHEDRTVTKQKICPFCKRLFLTVFLLFEHIITGCGTNYRLRSEVANGVRRTARNRLQCDICGEYFSSLWYLTRHSLWIHRHLTANVVDRMLCSLEDNPTIQERWCDFVLTIPPNYVSPDDNNN